MGINQVLEGIVGAPLPEGVNFDAQEAMTPEQLEHLLRQDFTGPVLKLAKVQRISDEAPWRLKIDGAFQCYGTTQYYETEIDIRGIEGADDFLELVNAMNASFNKAAERISKGGY